LKFATLCYVRSNGKTLMIHRIKKLEDMHAGKWNGLGGKLEPGETPEECARREIQEESGLRVSSLRWKGLLTFPQFSKQEDWYAFVFVADGFEGELSPSAEGELCWINDGELSALNLWEGDRIFLPWLVQPRFFSAKFIYQDGRLIDHQVVFYP
jgi:8-oxo-dGTP diphosphatase